MAINVSELRSKVDQVVGLREAVRSRLRGFQKEIKTLESEEELLDMVAALFRGLIDQEITDSVAAVEKLQTEGLQSVFDDQNLSVKGSIEIERGKVSVELKTLDKKADGSVIEGVVSDSFGGAVTTIQSILMRITLIVKRGMRPILLLDEALPAVNHDYVVNSGRFLDAICKRMGLDILLITHDTALVDAGHNPYRLHKGPDGEGILTRARGAACDVKAK